MIFRYGGRGVPPIPLRKIALKSRYFRSKNSIFFLFSYIATAQPPRPWPWAYMWKFLSFLHWNLILWQSKHILSYCEGSQKCSFYAPLHFYCFRNIHPQWERLVLCQKYPSNIRSAFAISEIYSTMRGLYYFRNNHPPLWEWLALFQKYPPTMRWAAVRGEIGDFSSCMKIDFFCKIRFRTHRIIILIFLCIRPTTWS